MSWADPIVARLAEGRARGAQRGAQLGADRSQAKAKAPPVVLVSERLGAIRISPHVYNTVADLEALIEGLREAVGRAGVGQARL